MGHARLQTTTVYFHLTNFGEEAAVAKINQLMADRISRQFRQNGKEAKVAIVASMRKLITIINLLIKNDGTVEQRKKRFKES